MANCTFCGTDIRRGTGLMYVKKDGKIFNFCTRKCEKNMFKLGRKPRVTRWTKEFALVKSSAKTDSKEKKVTKK
ncbi:50S ribosomal protein L24e [Candidatus Woesearchaeota archaeon CG11_big_fil_rev_8_21_14_0_20_43_8]|nr:MAG: 50S ribosomal protein L24e [Candidatus Woesearchaeota archaeon CG11_big_fil_rev_8_21_14_0_20_43_8]PIO04590.1 MAG: 50S ribosomal protein L24e [Candidatus Woesearchaeota archaeon CG08_land_8_20_14_0_20_43_7]